MKKKDPEKTVRGFISAINDFDVQRVLKLFAPNAVIDDVSVGRQFKKTDGVRDYLETYFVGYHTQTRLESLVVSEGRLAHATVDFTGDFGHETGVLDFSFDATGLIIRVNAHLD